MNEPESAACHGASDDAMPAPSTLRSPRARRPADSGSFPALTAPITVRARRFDNFEPTPAGRSEDPQRAASALRSSFPHRLAAPAFGAILSGILTYCLHQCGEPTAAHARLVRARTTYAADGVVAEPVRFEVELPDTAQVAPTERVVHTVSTRATSIPIDHPDAERVTQPVTQTVTQPVTQPGTQPGTVEPSNPLPVVRPSELRLARERPSRASKAATRTKKHSAREPGSARRRSRTRSRD